MKRDKKGLVWYELGTWIIALAALAVVILGIIILRGKGSSIFDRIKQLFIFWR